MLEFSSGIFMIKKCYIQSDRFRHLKYDFDIKITKILAFLPFGNNSET